jgi:hypothetical protein
LYHPTNQSHDAAQPIVQGINRDPSKVEIQVSQTTFIGMETMRSKLMLTLTASVAALLLALANQPVGRKRSRR